MDEFLDTNIQETHIGKQLARFHQLGYREVYNNYLRIYPQYANVPLDSMIVQHISNFNEKISLNVQYFTVA